MTPVPAFSPKLFALAVIAAGLAATPAAFTGPTAARAASFNCAAARAPSDVAICSNPILSGLDGQLGLAYTARLAHDPSARQIERAWLVARNTGCGHDVACLTVFTRAQLGWLQGSEQLTGTLPTRPGQCGLTAVRKTESRLDGMADSGSAVEESNSGYQVSYDMEPGIQTSRAGDPLILCLVSIPQHCPAGDDRGRFYAAGNLRTLKGWSLPDAEHMCGGA